MSYLLFQAAAHLTPLLHPDLPEPGVAYVAAFAEWVHERVSPFPTRGDSASHIHDIDASRYTCWLSAEGRSVEFVGYDPAKPDRLSTAANAALRYGVVTARFAKHPVSHERLSFPVHTLEPALDGAVALGVARRDVTMHLDTVFAGRPLPVVSIDGVDVNARQLGKGKDRTFERTVETRTPATTADLVDALLRKVNLEHVSTIGTVQYPTHRPSPLKAATLLRAETERLTDVPVPASAVPLVRWHGSRPVVTDELLSLVPALDALPVRMRATSAPVHAVASTSKSAPKPTIATKANQPAVTAVPSDKRFTYSELLFGQKVSA